jgi:hypothetical protein
LRVMVIRLRFNMIHRSTQRTTCGRVSAGLLEASPKVVRTCAFSLMIQTEKQAGS